MASASNRSSKIEWECCVNFDRLPTLAFFAFQLFPTKVPSNYRDVDRKCCCGKFSTFYWLKCRNRCRRNRKSVDSQVSRIHRGDSLGIAGFAVTVHRFLRSTGHERNKTFCPYDWDKFADRSTWSTQKKKLMKNLQLQLMQQMFYRIPQFNCCVVVSFCVIAQRLITHGITLNNWSTTGVASGATDVRDLEIPYDIESWLPVKMFCLRRWLTHAWF